MKNSFASQKTTTLKTTTFISLAAILACCCWSLWNTTKAAYDKCPDTDIHYQWLQKLDSRHMWTDAQKIMFGIEKRKTFGQAMDFWTGPWAMGEMAPYYRPVTSIAWWLMCRAWGRNGLAPFLMVLAVSHLAVALLLWRFLNDLLENAAMAAIAACAFTLGLGHSAFKLSTPAYALEMWIDHPEMWMALAYLGACWCFVKRLRAGGKWLWASLACFALGITIKEMIYSLPLMLVVLLWFEGRLFEGRFKEWRLLVPFGVVAALGLAIRTWALQGGGYRFGSNGAWLRRAVMETGGGEPMAILMRGEGLPLAVAGVLLFALALLVFQARLAAGISLALAAVGAYISARASAGFEDPFWYQLLGSGLVWRNAVYMAAWLGVLWFAVMPVAKHLREAQRIFRFGWLWAAASYCVLLTAPTTLHTLYIVSIGWGICLSAFLQALNLHWLQRVNAKRPGVLQTRSRLDARAFNLRHVTAL